MLILSTAISGSYLAACGVGFIVGGFPSIIEIYHIIENKGEVINNIHNIAANECLLLFRRNCNTLYSGNRSSVLY